MTRLADRFQAAREAFAHIESDLERWEQQIEAERSHLAQAVLGVRPGDIVTSQQNGALVRISAESISLYSTDKRVTFVVSGKRFRKDGTLGKMSETMSFALDHELGHEGWKLQAGRETFAQPLKALSP